MLLKNLMLQDHLLQKVQKFIDFSFIREKVRGLYSEDNGRPSVDPVVLFKMLFAGYLYGIRSERRLVEEIQVNLAYRWLRGLSIGDPVPTTRRIARTGAAGSWTRGGNCQRREGHVRTADWVNQSATTPVLFCHQDLRGLHDAPHYSRCERVKKVFDRNGETTETRTPASRKRPTVH